jgi:preprotein translocase subunit SecB
VKDLSFENPDAPNSLRQRQNPPRINININVQTNQLTGANAMPGAAQGSDYEVELKMEARAVDGEKALFAIELAYAGIFRITNVPAEQVRAVLLIEGPRLLFPFARQILADASRNGGFPPLMVDPVDFNALYRQRAAQAQAAAGQPPQRLV